MMSIKQEPDAQSSTMTDNMSTASVANQNGMMDPIDSLLDLSEYDDANQYNSPALSPANSKHSFVRTTAASTPASMLSASQPMSGPSHQYDQYKQQTGFVPGALANTFAVTQNGISQVPGYGNFDMNFVNMNSTDDMFDFNTAPPASVSPSDIDADFESPGADPSLFFAEQMSSGAPSVNMTPSVLSGQAHTLQSPPPIVPTNDVAGNVGRLWPGMHQQAAMAKAQAQQRQQQQIIQQQQMQRQMKPMAAPKAQAQAQGQSQRAKAGQPSDPIVEQKISQLLSSMRAKPSIPHTIGNNGVVSVSRPKKDEDDMDEDERLLASEEGKRLTSKERRQLRNKVSARAFRSRRKEYITQLEAEIAGKVTENGELRTQNRALAEENKRLADLTRMLLGSPSFSDFLDRLSSNPALVPQGSAAEGQVAPQVQVRGAPKDASPYPGQHQIGMAMIPEQNIDFSMLQMETEPSFSFQPQVYAVLETPDVASSIDVSVLSGKGSNFVGSFEEEEKVDMPILANPVIEKAVEAIQSQAAAVHDAEFESDPAFDLYHDAPATAVSAVAAPTESASTGSAGKPVELNADSEVMSEDAIFGGIETDKAFARYDLVDASAEEVEAAREIEESVAVARIARLCAGLKATTERLENMISRD